MCGEEGYPGWFGGGGGEVIYIIIFIGRLGPVWSPMPKEAVIVINEARLYFYFLFFIVQVCADG